MILFSKLNNPFLEYLDTVHASFDSKKKASQSDLTDVLATKSTKSPQVYGVTWNPHVSARGSQVFVTWGKKHCKLWSQLSGSFQATQLSFGRFDLQNVHSAAFLPISHTLVLGLARGDIIIFDGTTATKSIAAHSPGPQFIADDGCISFSGIRGMALHERDTVLLTAGMTQCCFCRYVSVRSPRKPFILIVKHNVFFDVQDQSVLVFCILF